MTRPLTYERIDQISSGVIEHGALSASVVLADLISIFDAAVERRLTESLIAAKIVIGCFRYYKLCYAFVKMCNHLFSCLYE